MSFLKKFLKRKTARRSTPFLVLRIRLEIKLNEAEDRILPLVGNEVFAVVVLKHTDNILEQCVLHADLPSLLPGEHAVVCRYDGSIITEMAISGERAPRAYVFRVNALVVELHAPSLTVLALNVATGV